MSFVIFKADWQWSALMLLEEHLKLVLFHFKHLLQRQTLLCFSLCSLHTHMFPVTLPPLSSRDASVNEYMTKCSSELVSRLFIDLDLAVMQLTSFHLDFSSFIISNWYVPVLPPQLNSASHCRNASLIRERHGQVGSQHMMAGRRNRQPIRSFKDISPLIRKAFVSSWLDSESQVFDLCVHVSPGLTLWVSGRRWELLT